MALSKKPIAAITIVIALMLASIVGGFFFFHSVPRATAERFRFPLLPAFVSLVYCGTGLLQVLRRAPSSLSSADPPADTADAELNHLALDRWGKDQILLGLSLAVVIVALWLSPLSTLTASTVCSFYWTAGMWAMLLRYRAFRRRQQV